MSKYTADILFHIDEKLDEQKVHQVEYDMAFQKGVRTACVNCSNPHLMLVDYDPMVVKARALLGALTSRGLHAEMVGF
jgi:hypothetical protein